MLESEFKESKIRNALKGLFDKKKRLREDLDCHISPPISIKAGDPRAWEQYIYYRNSGRYIYLSDDKPCDLLDIFEIADIVGDDDLMKKLLIWYERSSDVHNIVERVFSHRYQSHCFAPLQQMFRKIFLKLWMENDAVRDKTVEFLDQLEAEENGGDEWTAANARKLHCELMTQLPVQSRKNRTYS